MANDRQWGDREKEYYQTALSDLEGVSRQKQRLCRELERVSGEEERLKYKIQVLKEFHALGPGKLPSDRGDDAPAEDRVDSPSNGALRPGSRIARIHQILRDAGGPLHIDAILRRLGGEQPEGVKESVFGGLSRHVRRGRIFTRPAPSTFGLVEHTEAAGPCADPDNPSGGVDPSGG